MGEAIAVLIGLGIAGLIGWDVWKGNRPTNKRRALELQLASHRLEVAHLEERIAELQKREAQAQE